MRRRQGNKRTQELLDVGSNKPYYQLLTDTLPSQLPSSPRAAHDPTILQSTSTATSTPKDLSNKKDLSIMIICKEAINNAQQSKLEDLSDELPHTLRGYISASSYAEVISELNRIREKMRASSMSVSEHISYVVLGSIFVLPFVPMIIRRIQIDIKQKQLMEGMARYIESINNTCSRNVKWTIQPTAVDGAFEVSAAILEPELNLSN